MSPVRCTLAALALVVLLSRAAAAEPQGTAPPGSPEASPTPGTPQGLVLRIGVAGIVLPEDSRGMFGAQPEVRLGWFHRQRVAIQVEGSARVWPLGGIADRSYGVAGNVLWFPPFTAERRDFYLLAGGGGAYTEPAEGDASFDPEVRAGLGVLAPLAGLIPSLHSVYFAAEYRGALVFRDGTDFVSGIALGLSRKI